MLNSKIVTEIDIQALAPALSPTQHKYQAGAVTAWTGSAGMMGAASLSCEAALRSGAGYVRWLYAQDEAPLSTCNLPVEVVHQGFRHTNRKEMLPIWTSGASCLMGCGLGRTAAVEAGLREWVPQLQVPLVLDGDGLFFFAKAPFVLPTGTIFTPHLGELARLLQKPHLTQNQVESILPEAMAFAQQHRICLVLKGCPTYILDPTTTTAFRCDGGSPGMATAGTGDVLAGLLAGLLAQGISPIHAAISGVFLHQRAGEYAAREKTPRCMIASDLLAQFPSAFRSTGW